jgi:hypothetical protein
MSSSHSLLSFAKTNGAAGQGELANGDSHRLAVGLLNKYFSYKHVVGYHWVLVDRGQAAFKVG